MNERLGRTEDVPDINQAGVLIFSAYCDEDKLAKILEEGIKPRGGEPAPASYYPDVVSLNALAPEGYAETLSVRWGWNILALNMETHLLRRENIFRYTFVLNPEWVKANIKSFLAVGQAFQSDRGENRYLVNTLQALPITDHYEQFEDSFPEEVHYREGVLPSVAIRGIIADEPQFHNEALARRQIKDTWNTLKNKGKLVVPSLAVYRPSGEFVGEF